MVKTIHTANMTYAQGFKIKGEDGEGAYYTALGAGGDVNGDGLDDLLIGNAELNGYRGGAYVVLGRMGGNVNIDLANKSANPNVIYMNGTDVNGIYTSQFGRTVAIINNVTGNGYANAFISNRGLNGQIYVPLIDENTSNSIYLPEQSVIIEGVPYSGFGWSIKGAGDINGDGLKDIASAADCLLSSNNGCTSNLMHVVWGKLGGLSNMQMPPASGEGFTILSRYNENYFARLNGVGDVTCDGIDDLAIVSPTSDSNCTLYLLPGKQGGYAGNITIDGVNADPAVMIIGSGEDYCSTIFVGGDLDGDGCSDLAIGFDYKNIYFYYSDSYAGALTLTRGGTGFLNGTVPLQQISIISDNTEDCMGIDFIMQDIDQDGYADIGISSPCFNNATGKVDFIPGSNNIFSSDIQLPTQRMISIMGENYGDYFGNQVVVIGNMTGSRTAIAIESHVAGDGNGGTTYVVFLDEFPAESSSTIPTTEPTKSPTSIPTVESATHEPTKSPTISPSAIPSFMPTAAPTAEPTNGPTKSPTTSPSVIPSFMPTAIPTTEPTHEPTKSPTTSPSVIPSFMPTAIPTTEPTHEPTKSPTTSPSVIPSFMPTAIPTTEPTHGPTKSPTISPSAIPSFMPTAAPTTEPTHVPTKSPTGIPTTEPTTHVPTYTTTHLPTFGPSMQMTSVPGNFTSHTEVGDSDDASLSTGSIIGIIIGVVGAVAAAATGYYCYSPYSAAVVPDNHAEDDNDVNHYDNLELGQYDH